MTDEKNRSIVSGFVTLGVHAGLLLIPLLVLPISPPGQTVTGYITGLVEIEGTPTGKTEDTAPISSTAHVINTKPQTKKSIQSLPSQPINSKVPPVKSGEKAAPLPLLPPTKLDAGGEPGDKSDNNHETTGTSPSSSKTPAKPGLGNGQGQIGVGSAPIYPKNAQNEGVSGSVSYRVSIDATGRLTRSETLTSSGDHRLDAAALRAMKKWTFRPAEEDYFLVVQFIFSTEGVRVAHLSAGWAGETE